MAAVPISRGKSKVKMQKVKLQCKNSTVSRGTCCHGLFHNYTYSVQASRMFDKSAIPSTALGMTLFFAKQSQSPAFGRKS
jgi:hypothetical protein